MAAAAGPPPRAATPASSTPAASPRQPACTMPTEPGPASATGRQSATSTIAATPGRVVSCPSASCGWSASTATRVPWTWRPCASRAAPTCARTRSRFSRTRSGSSSVPTPRLSEANGPSETPPRRVGVVVGHSDERLARGVDLPNDLALAVACLETPRRQPEAARVAGDVDRARRAEVLAAEAPDHRRAGAQLAPEAAHEDADAVEI